MKCAARARLERRIDGRDAARAGLEWGIDERAPTRHMRKTARTGTVLRGSAVGDTDVGPS